MYTQAEWPHLYQQVQAAEARLHLAEQDTPPSQTSPPVCANQQPESAKQQARQAHRGALALPPADTAEADERQAQIRAVVSELIYWKGGLKVLRQAQLPKWRGCFKRQIEAKIEALQAAYARPRAACAKPDG